MKHFLASVWKALRLSKKMQLSVMRATQDQFLVGVTGIIFNDGDEILFLKHTYRQVSWGLPGGYLKAKEHPREGLVREIEEECGFVVSVDSRIKIRTDREVARLDICYVGTYIGGTFRPSHEVSDAKFFPFENIPLVSKNQLLLIQEAIRMRTKIKGSLRSKQFMNVVRGLFQ